MIGLYGNDPVTGTICHLKRNFDQTPADYNLAIALKPDYAAAYFFRASIYHLRGDVEPARADYTKAKSLDPKLPDLNIKKSSGKHRSD